MELVISAGNMHQCMNGLRLEQKLWLRCTLWLYSGRWRVLRDRRQRKKEVTAGRFLENKRWESLELQNPCNNVWVNPFVKLLWKWLLARNPTASELSAQIITCSFQWWLVLSDAGEAITAELLNENNWPDSNYIFCLFLIHFCS